jgi:hypothetical protein
MIGLTGRQLKNYEHTESGGCIKSSEWSAAKGYIGCIQDIFRGVTMNLLSRILVLIGSVASMGFGIWHFFVPTTWKWFSYIASQATELVAAIRAINAFFSLSLVLFGMINILLIYGGRSNQYSISVVLAATCVLWLTRVAFQVIYPQGSQYPGLQYGMLAAFLLISLCYIVSLFLVLSRRSVA